MEEKLLSVAEHLEAMKDILWELYYDQRTKALFSAIDSLDCSIEYLYQLAEGR